MSNVVRRRSGWMAIGLGLLLIAATAYLIQYRSNLHANVPLLLSEVAVNPPRLVSNLNLMDHEQHVVTPERFASHWTFVFFGYSNCPDVCPATLTQLVQMNSIIHHTPQLDGKFQFYFVSVDPERDTIQHLADYIGYFDKGFTAMPGGENDIHEFEKELGAYHRIEKKDKSNYYAVQHSSEIYLIDPAGRLTAKFTPPMDLALVIRQLGMFVERYPDTVS